LAEYGRNYESIRAAGADTVALSVDAQARSQVKRQLALPFPLLCDPARTVVRAWGFYNPREMGGIAIPAVFVIGADRCVRCRSIDSTRERVATDGVLRFLRGDVRMEALGPVRVRAGLSASARVIANAVRRGLRTSHEGRARRSACPLERRGRRTRPDAAEVVRGWQLQCACPAPGARAGGRGAAVMRREPPKSSHALTIS